MKFYLKKSESPGDGIRRINRELRVRVREILADASMDADTAVHELRKCVKKLRAVLRFSRPALKKSLFQDADRVLRDFARRISGTRDSAVMVKSFDELMDHYRPYLSEPDLLQVRQNLQNRHVMAMASYQANLDSREFGADVRRIERRLDRMGEFSMSRSLLLSGVRDVYRRARKLYRVLERDPSTENSHRLRRQSKYLWYQLTLLKKQIPSHMKSVTGDLARLGELLGNDNDMSVLVETLHRHPEICCNNRRAELIASLAETRRVQLLSSALQVARRVYGRKSGRFIRSLTGNAG